MFNCRIWFLETIPRDAMKFEFSKLRNRKGIQVKYKTIMFISFAGYKTIMFISFGLEKSFRRGNA